MNDSGGSRKNIVKSPGLVFGDLGTSPIYTVGAIMLFMLPAVQNIFGLLSLITWTLVIISLLEKHGIDEKTIFYGIETIVSDQIFWKIYSTIKKVSQPFVQFYTLPPEKMHGVVTRVMM